MRLVTFRHDVESAARLGAIWNGLVVDLGALGEEAGFPMPDRMLDFIDLGPAALVSAQEWFDEFDGDFPFGTAFPLEDVTLLAPIPRPRKNVFCIGLNYVDHINETADLAGGTRDLPSQPVVFSKPPTAIIGPGASICHNAAITAELDWEVELAVIMGRRTCRVAPEDALDYVFGYSVLIDISARDQQGGTQWLFSKGQDSYAPFGPCIVTANEIADPQQLNLWLTVNGVEKQRSNTAQMLFDVRALIAHLSSGMTLEAGDIIATGTPEGVGAGRNPKEFLWPGDVVQACVEGIGCLTHPVTDTTAEGATRRGTRPANGGR